MSFLKILLKIKTKNTMTQSQINKDYDGKTNFENKNY